MWLATKLGFYSVVRKGRDYHVRARLKRDLLNLKEFTGCNAKLIQSPPTADYRWRMIVRLDVWQAIMVRLVDSVDYANFKSKIDHTPDQCEKHGAYARLWAELHQIQSVHDARPNPRYPRPGRGRPGFRVLGEVDLGDLDEL